MMRTVAPKERGGRLLRNWARTTPELPVLCIRHGPLVGRLCASNHTVWPGDLAPDDSDLGAADLLRGAVDEGNLLSEVEAVLLISHAGLKTSKQHSSSPGGLGVLDTLNLDQAGTGVGVALAPLVAEVTSPVKNPINPCLHPNIRPCRLMGCSSCRKRRAEISSSYCAGAGAGAGKFLVRMYSLDVD